MKPKAVLGISAFYHDSAAALLLDGKIKAIAQEERFTRIRHDPSFPHHAIRYVLEEAGLNADDLEKIVYYEKPLLKFERILETYHAFAPKGLLSFITAIPVWIKEKLFMRKMLNDAFLKLDIKNIPLLFSEHHLSHAASAFYPSPFENAAILSVDGVGEWSTTTIACGEDNKIKILKELHFPHSLGLLYSAFTYYLGFKVNSGEYKLMGLAPYADPGSQHVKTLTHLIKSELVDIREDGSFLLNLKYFGYATGLKMTDNKRWKNLFGIARRLPEAEITIEHVNLAMAIQQVTEEIMLKLANTARSLTGYKCLVMAGGVALNCVANSKILESGIFEKIWVQPASGDAGGALGAAYAAWYLGDGNKRNVKYLTDEMQGSLLGPAYFKSDIAKVINKYKVAFKYYQNFQELCDEVAGEIDRGKVIGWFQGRMEFGPRALGNRSILGDPRSPEMQKKINLKVKNRESFRPFAPSVLEEDAHIYFNMSSPSPYMLFTHNIKDKWRTALPLDYKKKSIAEQLYLNRSALQAITHVDYSARVQTVNNNTNPKFYQLISAFKKLTGIGVLINTSFNVRAEPIVCTPEDAYLCFRKTDIDLLVINNYLLEKSNQPELQK